MNLETKDQKDLTVILGSEKTNGVLMMTPPIGDDYWLYRVPVSEEQAIIAFPKFCMIGIGFQHEEDWNTNLPYTCGAEEIFNHISHNKGDDAISDADCIQAIKIIQEAINKERVGEVKP